MLRATMCLTVAAFLGLNLASAADQVPSQAKKQAVKPAAVKPVIVKAVMIKKTAK